MTRHIVLVAALAGLVGADGRAQDLIEGKAPDFTLKDVNGKAVARRDFEGKVVVLDFWAVWCGPCQISLPFFQEMADKYKGKGLEVVGLHVDDRVPPVEEMRRYLEDLKIRYTNLLSTWRVDEAYQIFAMPTTYLIDRKGRIVDRHIGFNPTTAPELERQIAQLLAAK